MAHSVPLVTRRRSAVAGMALFFLAGSASATRNDILASFSSDNVLTVKLGDAPDRTIDVGSGSISLQTDDPFCVPSPSQTCHYRLNQVYLELQSFNVETNHGTFLAERAFAIIETPLDLTDSGDGIDIPAGTPMSGGAIVSGPDVDRGWHIESNTLPASVKLRLSPAEDIVTLDGTFDFTFHVEDEVIPGHIEGLAAAVQPLRNTAPVANAGDDFTLICPQTVTLDGSRTTDKENNLLSQIWNVDTFGVLEGDSVSVFLGEGVHSIHLSATDTFSGLGQDDLQVTIIDPPPEFTFVPPAQKRLHCGPTDIGLATAVSPCGPVTMANDAPASFPAGLTTVTWTATSVTGKTSTATEDVLVLPDDDPACCPPGTNVVVGTIDRDELVGTPGPDCILGLDGADFIDGLGGDDVIGGGGGKDVIHAGAGDDFINGGNGADILEGQGGDDILFGQEGADRMDGGPGKDRIFGGIGLDKLVCDAADSPVFGDEGNDGTLEPPPDPNRGLVCVSP